MFRVPLVAFLIAATALSGCLGGGDDPEDSPTNTDGANGGGSNMTLVVTILDYTTVANTSEPINITWEVSVPLGSNSTNVTIEHTDIHFGNQTIDDPTNTTNGTYSEQSDEMNGPAGEYNATFMVDTNGTLYVRAHASLNGTDYWSDEVVIQVNAGIPPLGTVHEVDIGALLPGALAEYDPDDLTIKVGDGVKWINRDRIAPHTATSDEGAPQAFDTGNIAAGGSAASGVIQFTVAGEYTYHCNVHAGMEGSLTVE